MFYHCMTRETAAFFHLGQFSGERKLCVYGLHLRCVKDDLLYMYMHIHVHE